MGHEVRKVRLGRTQLQVSEIAFGGIPVQRLSREDAVRMVREVIDLGVTFIDTAHGYTDSEEKIGAAIRTYPRESLVIASKSPALDAAGFREHLDLSLRRLGIDCIDIYQHHNVNTAEKIRKVMGPGGAHEAMREAISEGKIRFPGFSSHSLQAAKELLLTGKFDVVQLPFNFVDDEAAREIIPLCSDLDIGFICMKPLGGGLLNDARLCFRFLRQFPGIVPDPGIERIEELTEILGIYAQRGPLSAGEKASIDAIRKDLSGAWCHRCDYCQPCPQEIPISTVLTARSMPNRMPGSRARSMLDGPMTAAETCIACGECVSRCPYGLDVPRLLEEQRSDYRQYVETGSWPR